MSPLRKVVPWIKSVRAEVIMILCFAAWLGVTAWFVSYSVNVRQHQWCELLHTLTLPPPPASPPLTARQVQIIHELTALKGRLGC